MGVSSHSPTEPAAKNPKTRESAEDERGDLVHGGRRWGEKREKWQHYQKQRGERGIKGSQHPRRKKRDWERNK